MVDKTPLCRRRDFLQKRYTIKERRRKVNVKRECFFMILYIAIFNNTAESTLTFEKK